MFEQCRGMVSCWLHQPKPLLMKCRRFGGSGQGYQATQMKGSARPIEILKMGEVLETNEIDSDIDIT